MCRSILGNPKIILLDEPTSALDNISEKNIMNSLFSLDATLIVVAHRLASISQFDQVVLMDQGRIMAVGTHQELLKSSAIYQQLYTNMS
jgi:ABC-type bacteriocin/lantibiotic exporter with double-glycine peptidase domain